jgi:Flp pilus assembly protein TadG
LILPVLLLILLSIVQIVFILAAQVGITNAVREAARLAAVTTPTTTAGQASVNGAGVMSALTNGTTGYLKRNVFAYSNANLATGAGSTQVCYESFLDASSKPAVKVKVQATYRHSLFIPLIGAILDGIDGTSGDGFRVSASEEMRVENDELISPFSLSTTCSF